MLWKVKAPYKNKGKDQDQNKSLVPIPKLILTLILIKNFGKWK